MRPDEAAFARWVLENCLLGEVGDVRDVPRTYILRGDINRKRAGYILEKWTRKGWYDYGVNIELGWIWDNKADAMRKAVDALATD